MKRGGLFIVLFLSISLGQTYKDFGEIKRLYPVDRNSVSDSYKSMGASVRWFRNEAGNLVGVTDRVVVKWNSEKDVQATMDELNLTGSSITDKIWVITVPATYDVFELANTLSDRPETVYAQPDFIKERSFR